jgi:hypothetical protein
MFFLDRDRNQNIFDWSPHPKFVSDGTGTKILNFFSPGPRPGPKFFFDRDQNLFSPGPGPEFFFHRDRGQNFFLAGTGTKNDCSRSFLGSTLMTVIAKSSLIYEHLHISYDNLTFLPIF